MKNNDEIKPVEIKVTYIDKDFMISKGIYFLKVGGKIGPGCELNIIYDVIYNIIWILTEIDESYALTTKDKETLKFIEFESVTGRSLRSQKYIISGRIKTDVLFELTSNLFNVYEEHYRNNVQQLKNSIVSLTNNFNKVLDLTGASNDK